MADPLSRKQDAPATGPANDIDEAAVAAEVADDRARFAPLLAADRAVAEDDAAWEAADQVGREIAARLAGAIAEGDVARVEKLAARYRVPGMSQALALARLRAAK